MLRATDLLPLLVTSIGELDPTPTIKRYIATQYVDDRDIKFKQVDLKRTLTGLFVDVPIGEKRRRENRDRKPMFNKIGGHFDDLDSISRVSSL